VRAASRWAVLSLAPQQAAFRTVPLRASANKGVEMKGKARSWVIRYHEAVVVHAQRVDASHSLQVVRVYALPWLALLLVAGIVASIFASTPVTRFLITAPFCLVTILVITHAAYVAAKNSKPSRQSRPR